MTFNQLPFKSSKLFFKIFQLEKRENQTKTNQQLITSQKLANDHSLKTIQISSQNQFRSDVPTIVNRRTKSPVLVVGRPAASECQSK